MRTNADLTIYSKGVDAATRSEKWTRSIIPGVAWQDRRIANARIGGELRADAIAVYIPMARGPLSIKAGDMIVRGQVTDEITTGFTITDLKGKYPESGVVRSVDKKDLGSLALQHYQIGAA